MGSRVSHRARPPRLKRRPGRRRKVVLDRSPWYVSGRRDSAIPRRIPQGRLSCTSTASLERRELGCSTCATGASSRPATEFRFSGGSGTWTGDTAWELPGRVSASRQQCALKQTGWPPLAIKRSGWVRRRRRATRPTLPAAPRRSTSRSPSRETSIAPSAASGGATNPASHSLASQRTTRTPGNGSICPGRSSTSPRLSRLGRREDPRAGARHLIQPPRPRARRRRWRPRMPRRPRPQARPRTRAARRHPRGYRPRRLHPHRRRPSWRPPKLPRPRLPRVRRRPRLQGHRSRPWATSRMPLRYPAPPPSRRRSCSPRPSRRRSR